MVLCCLQHLPCHTRKYLHGCLGLAATSRCSEWHLSPSRRRSPMYYGEAIMEEPASRPAHRMAYLGLQTPNPARPDVRPGAHFDGHIHDRLDDLHACIQYVSRSFNSTHLTLPTVTEYPGYYVVDWANDAGYIAAGQFPLATALAMKNGGMQSECSIFT